MSPSFIYFDLDNTLLNHTRAEELAQHQTWNAFNELQQVSLAHWLDVYRQVNHHLWELYQRDEVDRYQLQDRRFRDSMKRLNLQDEVSEVIGEAYLENYRRHWTWIDGAEECLAAISENFETGIITNGFKETQQKKFEAMSLTRYCSRFLISEDVGVMKPHSDVFDRATEMAGVKRNEILYVGDSYSSDIIGGNGAGWKTAWFTGMMEGPADSGEADISFSRFDELLRYLKL